MIYHGTTPVSVGSRGKKLSVYRGEKLIFAAPNAPDDAEKTQASDAAVKTESCQSPEPEKEKAMPAASTSSGS